MFSEWRTLHTHTHLHHVGRYFRHAWTMCDYILSNVVLVLPNPCVSPWKCILTGMYGMYFDHTFIAHYWLKLATSGHTYFKLNLLRYWKKKKKKKKKCPQSMQAGQSWVKNKSTTCSNIGFEFLIFPDSDTKLRQILRVCTKCANYRLLQKGIQLFTECLLFKVLATQTTSTSL